MIFMDTYRQNALNDTDSRSAEQIYLALNDECKNLKKYLRKNN